MHYFLHQVAGLIGKLITGPWMKRFYCKSMEQTSYVQAIEDVRRMVSKCSSAEPCDLLTWEHDCFDDPLESCPGLANLQKSPSSPMFPEMMKNSLQAIVDLLQRQYSIQFAADLEPLTEATKSARTNNIDCEEVMGMLSASLQRAPSATISFHSAKIRAQKNHTAEFLEKSAEKDALVKKASKIGNFRLKRGRQLQKSLLEELQQRQALKLIAREKTGRNKIEKKMKKVEAGGSYSEEFGDQSEQEVKIVGDLLRGDSVGQNICHTWIDDGTPVVCNGHIEKFKKAKKMYVVAYWAESESYDDAVDYNMKATELATDFFLKDLVI